MVRICYQVPNGPTYEGNPIWNCTVPVSNRSRVNRVDPYHSGSDPIRIWTYPISCKRSFKLRWLWKHSTRKLSFDVLGMLKCAVTWLDNYENQVSLSRRGSLKEMTRNQVKNFFILHFHQFSSDSVDILVPNVDLFWDIENFYAHALLRFSDSGNIDKSNPWCNKGMSDVNG